MNSKMFANQYALSKTLRFELIPQGQTLTHIQEKGILEQDTNRALSYQRLKKIIDEYHKVFIESSLQNLILNDLDLYVELYHKKERTELEKKAFEKVKETLRKQISQKFQTQEKYKTLFAKELIKDDLLSFVDESDKALINEFRDFTTYFTGFHENRKNMYVADEKATSIAYRAINENLPKFLDNINVYQQILSKAGHLKDDFKTALLEMDELSQGISIEEIFNCTFFNSLISQRGIEFYNIIIGGRVAQEGQTKIKGLNEYINLYNQQQKDKNLLVPKFKQLYKQILSDRSSGSFVLENFESDNQMLESIEQFYQSGLCNVESEGNTIDILNTISSFLKNLERFNLSNIFLQNDAGLTDLSQRIFGDWNVIRHALDNFYQVNYPLKPKEKPEKFEERKSIWLIKTAYFDIHTIQTAIDGYDNELVSKVVGSNCIVNSLSQLGKGNDSNLNLVECIREIYAVIKDLLNNSFPEDENLNAAKQHVLHIKNFLDSILKLVHFVKILNVRNISGEKDETFYSVFYMLFDTLAQSIPLYNKVRNHLTKKPYSTQKIKLNFENSTLLNGWDVNKEADNSGILLRKDGLYYLGIMDKKHNKIFDKKVPICKDKKSAYEKVNYKLLPGANKMLPKVFLSKKGIETFNPSLEILENYQNQTHKKGETFNLSDMHSLIDYFKVSIAAHPDWKNFNHQFSPTSSYEDISGFYREVEKQGYKITFTEIDSDYVEELVADGKLYLFQIYNKDFSKFSKGTPNMHTLYWKMLFDEANLKDIVYKLNGEAEIFFRKSSITQNNLIVHKANQAIQSKNELNPKRESVFAYDITKNKRFTLDKFQFHVPITMNFKATGTDNINLTVNEFLKNNSTINILGLDRGERHLIYYTLLNQKGEILEQGSLNEITNERQKVNYKNLLVHKEGERTAARKDWNTIENIKEIKEGYLSQVVHKIASLMVEKNAIVVLEDLNMGFMRGRQKVERQVYQKLEKMLIDKLNYLVFKTRLPNEPGGLLNALQLTSRFESFRSLGKQSGFLFYVPAWNTSKIDPTTGFVDFLKPKYESIVKAKSFFENFEHIRFNGQENYFEFDFDYARFTTKADGTQTKWKVCTHGIERYGWNNKLNSGKGAIELINVTQSLQLLLDEFNIPYGASQNLKFEILQQSQAEFFKRLMRLLAITLSLRHSNGIAGEEEKDYILSPVKNQTGCFFNSNEVDPTLPQNADANGAYHIGLKGVWVLQQINQSTDLRKTNLAITNKEWLQFVQQKRFH